jgi:aspartate/methionine/tyrosine aminotransferase
LVKSHHIFLLIDETYAELWFRDKPKLNFLDNNNNVIVVSSLSKAYGLPGIRLGWLICKNKNWMEKFLAAKEQMVICNSILDEEIGFQFYLRKNDWKLKNKIDVNLKRQLILEWMAKENRLAIQKFLGGVVCFPKIRNAEETDIQLFYKILNTQFGTYVGPGRWFEIDDAFFRIGYGWPSINELESGLYAISESLKQAARK